MLLALECGDLQSSKVVKAPGVRKRGSTTGILFKAS